MCLHFGQLFVYKIDSFFKFCRFGHTTIPPGIYRRDRTCNFRKGPYGEMAMRLCSTWWDSQVRPLLRLLFERTCTSQCGNFRISLSLRFYVKSNFGDSRSAKSAILTLLEAPHFDFYEFLNFRKAEIYQN